MTIEVMVFLLVVGVLVLLVFMYPKIIKRYSNSFNDSGEYFKKRKLDPQKPTTKEIGKLVRKVIDKKPLVRNSYKLGYRKPGLREPTSVPKDYYYRYYVTFETFKGYKSFTVDKNTFRSLHKDKYGYIIYQKTKFIDFEMRPKETLHINELLEKETTKKT